jgi:hypothetical protein
MTERDHRRPGETTTFFKYCSNERIEDLFKKRKIRFTQPWALNDPLEFNPIIEFDDDGKNRIRFVYQGVPLPSECDRLRLYLVERQVNRYGILSLTKIPDSFDMWSLYANGHKGFMLELKDHFNEDPCMRSAGQTVHEVREVVYIDRYAININHLTDSSGSISVDKFNDQMFY